MGFNKALRLFFVFPSMHNCRAEVTTVWDVRQGLKWNLKPKKARTVENISANRCNGFGPTVVEVVPRTNFILLMNNQFVVLLSYNWDFEILISQKSVCKICWNQSFKIGFPTKFQNSIRIFFPLQNLYQSSDGLKELAHLKLLHSKLIRHSKRRSIVTIQLQKTFLFPISRNVLAFQKNTSSNAFILLFFVLFSRAFQQSIQPDFAWHCFNSEWN